MVPGSSREVYPPWYPVAGRHIHREVYPGTWEAYREVYPGLGGSQEPPKGGYSRVVRLSGASLNVIPCYSCYWEAGRPLLTLFPVIGRLGGLS